jgi:hypothetical protein
LKKFYFWLTCLLFAQISWAQTNISGTINSYAAVTAINGSNCVLTVTAATGFAPGDMAILMQMQGATFDQTNTANYGNLSALNGAGNYEVVEIQSISGTDITLSNALSRTYEPGTGRVQLVSFPEYADANVVGTLTGQAWNGTTGGVIALQVTGTLTLNADIDATRLGFRGGDVSADGGDGACYNQIANGPFSSPGGMPENNNYFYASTSVQGGGKGEGIGGIITNQESGYGKALNGGGGGNNHNHGGGGGSNYGQGGSGGDRSSGCFLGTAGRGVGGVALSGSYTTRVFLGGGGGGGHQNNANAQVPGDPGWNGATPGGPGGGIVLIKAGTLNGNGRQIIARGDSTFLYRSVEDGGGGGGAGGAVLLDVTTHSGSLTINVSGGNGKWTRNDAISTQSRRLGPGGGGGGGVAWFRAAALPAGITVNAAGGINGFALETNASAQYVNAQARNATAGAAGASLFDLTLPIAAGSSCATAFSLDAVRLSALALPSEVNLNWQLPPNMHFERHTLERAELGEAFMPIGEYAAGNLTYWHAMFTT